MEDLKESVAEMDEMEQLRIEQELEKQQVGGRTDHRDSGMGEEQDQRGSRHQPGNLGPGSTNLKRGAINNSLLDLVTDTNSVLGYGHQDKPGRRGSVGSLGELVSTSSLLELKDSFLVADSGMSVSFQSGSAGSAGTVSQDSSPQQLGLKTAVVHHGRHRQLSNGGQSTQL